MEWTQRSTCVNSLFALTVSYSFHILERILLIRLKSSEQIKLKILFNWLLLIFHFREEQIPTLIYRCLFQNVN